MIKASEDERGIGIELSYTNTKGIKGKLRKSAEDFIVEEISLPPPKEEEGEYAIVKVRARNWETNRLIRQISRRLGISRNRIGFAGTKDRRAVTTQLISIKAPEDSVKRVHMRDLEVLETYRSNRGLDLGNLMGNSFEIVIRDLETSEIEAEKLVNETLGELSALGGFPNFFGHQRFGAVRPITHLVGKKIIDGDFKGAVLTYLGNPVEIEGNETFEARRAVEEGVGYSEALRMFPKHLGFERALLNHLVKDENDFLGALSVLPRNLSMMFVHAYQSYLFNRILSRRIEKGLPGNEPTIGDIVLPIDANGLPDHKKWIDVSGENINKVRKRIAEKKAYLSGLVPGAEVRIAKGEQGELESAVLEEEGAVPKDFIVPQKKELSSKGMRRELVSPIRNFEWDVKRGAGVRMRFDLPKGCYATALLREFMKGDMLNY
jgi:tRNA pseudouridine13 synthase